MRKCLFVCVAFVLAACVAGCGSSGKGQSSRAESKTATGSSKSYAELRIGMPPFPGAIDWLANGWGQVAEIESLAVQGLVEIEPDGKLRPNLASSVERPNATTYVYNIRSGVRFSDGKPLTAADVVYSLDLNLSKEAGGWKAFWADVASVAAHGDSAVVVKLKRPNATWPADLAFTDQIVEKAVAAKVGVKSLGTPHDLPIGTGPWKIDSYTPEASVQLSRNPYWKGTLQPAAKISITMFKNEATMALALRSGGIDGAIGFASQGLFANIPATHIETGAASWSNFLVVNTKIAPFNDAHVRRAIAYAIDADSIVKALYPRGGAQLAETIVPTPAFADFPSTQVNELLATLPKYGFDLAAARRELARSAYPHGFATEIQAAVNQQNLVTAAEIIASELTKIGIKARVHEVPLDEYESLYGSNKVRLWLFEQSALYPDPDALSEFVNPEDISSTGNDVASFRNATVTKLLSEEEGEVGNPTRRLQLIGKLLKVTGTEVPYIPLFTHSLFFGLSAKYVAPEWSLFRAFYTPWALDVKLAR